MAQTRQRQRLAKICPDNLKAQKRPPDLACHFGQGSNRYDVQLVKVPIFQLLGKSKSV